MTLFHTIRKFLSVRFFGGLLPFAAAACAVSGHAEITTQHFALDCDSIGDSEHLDAFCVTLDSLYAAGDIQRVTVYGTASPEGTRGHNNDLSLRRARSMAAYIAERTSVPREMFVTKGLGEDWSTLQATLTEYLTDNDLVHVIAIINSTKRYDERERELRKVTRIWNTLFEQQFPTLRRAWIIALKANGDTLNFVYTHDPLELVEEDIAVPEADPIADVEVNEEAEVVAPVVAVAPEVVAPCAGGRHLTSNALEWALAIANLRGEYDFACRWSAGVSLHYSAWNYASATRKFRTFIFRPEVRYWFGQNHHGLFVDVHLQMAAYNFALPGRTYRIQDVGGKQPALGGGFGAGFRLPLSRNGRWSAEGAIGVGVYRLHYDRFLNRPNGMLFDTPAPRAWAGIDNVSLSIVYNFNAAAKP